VGVPLAADSVFAKPELHLGEDQFGMGSLSFPGRFFLCGRDMSGPRHPGLRLVLRRFPRHRRNLYEMAAAGALNLPARELLVASEMLLAMWALEFEFAHGI
jgi:hypothetical protein